MNNPSTQPLLGHDVSAKVAQMLQTRSTRALAHFQTWVQGASEKLLAGSLANPLCAWQLAAGSAQYAIDIVHSYGERLVLPQPLIAQAAIEGARGDTEAAELSIRRSVVEARGQGASWQEFLALTELFERAIPTPSDWQALAAQLDEFRDVAEEQLFARSRRLVGRERLD